ncbi:MAG: Asd/ArgC dimerization domain-containing protein [Candidatus Acidiferrales bacterium]
MPSGASKPPRVAIVGASSLRGKELKLVLEERNFPVGDIVLLEEPVAAGTLTAAGGEPAFVRALDENSFEGAQFAFFAGSERDAEQNWQAAQRSGATVIDMTGALSAAGKATSWIPSLSSVLLPRPGAATSGASRAAIPYSSPGPGTVIACTVAAGLSKLSPTRVAIVLYVPVSERDQAGVDELESQTTNLLSFRPIEQTVFDTQVAFNMLSAFGESAKPTLAGLRAAIVRSATHCLAGRAAVPALQVVQAPVFYGYAFSAYVEFGAAIAPEQIETALLSLGVRVAANDDAPPSNLSVVGEGDIHLARPAADASVPNAIWLWGVADNLRLAAVNAVRIAEELVAEPKIQ